MKRACPYDANLLRMSKVHLMDHDVDMEALHRMHEKTVSKLMSGARSSFSVPVSSPTPNGLQPAIMSTGKSMKQMEMTRYFNPLGDHLQSATLAKKSCDDNNDHTTYDEGSFCSYCDKKCTTNQCRNCGDHFCDSCCLVKYDITEDEHICISCS